MTRNKTVQAGERTQSKLRVEDTVRVYGKPITDEKLEGLATLVQHHPDSDDREIGERWSVRFTGEDQIVDRWVSFRNIQGYPAEGRAQ